jgi:hypothetical protein
MSTNPLAEERMRILNMVKDGQITAEEAARLLEALKAGASASDVASPANSAPPKWLRVRVTDRATGKTKVNVNVPIGLLDVGLKMGAHFAPDMGGMDWSAIQAAIKGGVQGRIVEVEDEEDDERVEIFVE